MRKALSRSLAFGTIFAAVAIAYWPGLHAFWGRDDFMQLAYARLIGSPWPLFVHDHYFPVPGSIFRPLGFASFWLSYELFGTNYAAHAFGDLLLHGAVSLALYRVVRIGGLDRLPAVVCALLFAVHPVVLGTALWWSARFDLMAALFAFIALRAAFDYVDRQRIFFLLVALIATLAALLSKETAVAIVAAISLVWVRWAWTDRAARAVARRALLAIVLVAIGVFCWRCSVLGTATSGLAGDTPLLAAIGNGIVAWLDHLAGYLSFWSRLGAVQHAITVMVVVMFAVVAIIALARYRSGTPRPREIDLLICGLCILLLPAVLQAPVVALNAAPLRGDTSAVEAAMQSRLYYLSIGGAVIVLSVLIARVLRTSNAGLRACLLGVLGAWVLVLGWAARESAAAYAMRASEPKAIAQAAVAAAERIELLAGRCHIFLLGAPVPPEWGVYVSMDSIVKALGTDRRVDRCFIHSDQPTYFHLMDNAASADDALPYRPREVGGHPLPWQRVGSAAVAYLDPLAQASTEDFAGMTFLLYENGVFRDATADVVAGRVRVNLQ